MCQNYSILFRISWTEKQIEAQANIVSTRSFLTPLFLVSGQVSSLHTVSVKYTPSDRYFF